LLRFLFVAAFILFGGLYTIWATA